MRIRVSPDQLRSLSAQLQQVAGDLWAVESRVGGALRGLDWEARQKVGVKGQVAHARNQARALAAQAEEMSRYLVGKAQAFEDADGQGVGRIGEVAGAFTEIQGQWMQGPGVRYSFPHLQIETQMRLGQIAEVQPDRPVPVPTPTPVPVVPGGETTIAGLAALTPLSTVLSPVRDFGERVWNWLNRRGFKTYEEIRKEEEERRRQEEERKQREEQRKQEEEKRQEERRKQQVVSVDVPYFSQWDVEAQQGRANCGPASLAMVINHYGGSVTVDTVASKIPRDPTTGYTDFRSEKVKDYLLKSHRLKEEDVDDFDGLQKHLGRGHPVIMRVDNSQYIREENDRDVPYPNTSGFSVAIAHSWGQSFNKSKFRNFLRQIRTGLSEQHFSR